MWDESLLLGSVGSFPDPGDPSDVTGPHPVVPTLAFVFSVCAVATTSSLLIWCKQMKLSLVLMFGSRLINKDCNGNLRLHLSNSHGCRETPLRYS